MRAGWHGRPLGECIERVKYDSKIPKSEFLETGSYPIVSQEADFVNGFWDKSTDLFKVERPVVVFGDHTLVLKYIDFDFVIGADGVKVLKPKPFLYPKYFYYFLRSVRLKRLGYARHYRLLANIDVIYPSLSEQERIVAILDEAFEGIDRAIANTKKNLANAREVFESYLNSIFMQQDSEWKEGTLGEIGGDVYTGPFGSLLHKSDYITGGIPLVNPAHIVEGKIIPDKDKTIDAPALERLKNYCLRKDDVVIGRRGEIGRCAVVTDTEAGWLCGTGCFYVRVFKETNPVFLAHLLRSRPYRERLEALSTGATMLNLSNTSLGALSIRLPVFEKQEIILEGIEAISSQIRNLELTYHKKSRALTALKQVVLQKAFAGELTARSVENLQEAAQ